MCVGALRTCGEVETRCRVRDRQRCGEDSAVVEHVFPCER